MALFEGPVAHANRVTREEKKKENTQCCTFCLISVLAGEKKELEKRDLILMYCRVCGVHDSVALFEVFACLIFLGDGLEAYPSSVHCRNSPPLGDSLTHSLILACLCGRCLPNHPEHLPLLGD